MPGDDDRSGTILWTTIVVLVVGGLWAWMVVDCGNCVERGGAYVETPYGYQCVEKK